jgi:hypothetical protein
MIFCWHVILQLVSLAYGFLFSNNQNKILRVSPIINRRLLQLTFDGFMTAAAIGKIRLIFRALSSFSIWILMSINLHLPLQIEIGAFFYLLLHERMSMVSWIVSFSVKMMHMTFYWSKKVISGKQFLDEIDAPLLGWMLVGSIHKLDVRVEVIKFFARKGGLTCVYLIILKTDFISLRLFSGLSV